MRRLLVLVLVVATAWAGYWVVGSTASQKGTEKWLEDRRTDGWLVEYADLSVAGFPNRFDTNLTDIELTDPDTGLSWKAPFFQIFALSYQPNHLIANWPETQTLATPFQRVDITSSKMQASLKVKPSTNLELDNATVVIEGLQMVSNAGWSAGADTANLAIRETVGKEMHYDLALAADKVIPGEALRNLIDAGGTLPDLIEGLRVDLEIGVTEPFDIRVIEDARPDLTSLKVNEIRGAWGQLELRAKGDLTIDAQGLPSGELALNARNWRQMLQLAVQAGALSSQAAQGAELGLGLLARLSGNEDSLDVPLSFSGGRSFLGPVPIGPAPVLKLR